MKSTHPARRPFCRLSNTLCTALSLLLCALALAGCENIQPDPDKLHIVERSSSLFASNQEVINLENCGGSADVEREITNRVDSRVHVDASLSADILAWLEGQVELYYERSWSSERTLRLKAIPGSHVVYVITWETKIRAGDILYDDVAGKGSYQTTEVIYSAVESQNIACPGAVPPAPAGGQVVYAGYARSDMFPSLGITQVLAADDATIVSFRLEASEDLDDLTLHGPGGDDAFYLIDQRSGVRYALLALRGPITFDQPFQLAAGDTLIFQLVFEPLGPSVVHIDVIEGAHINTEATYWDIYGIALSR